MIEVENAPTTRRRGRPRKLPADTSAAGNGLGAELENPAPSVSLTLGGETGESPVTHPAGGPVAAAAPSLPAASVAFDFSRGRQKFNDALAFQSFCESYPDRRALMTYLFRLDPAIDRGQVGIPDSNVEKIPGSLDLDRAIETHGSGEYQAKFTDANRSPAEIASCVFRLSDVDRPPLLAPEELVIDGAKGQKNASVINRYRERGYTIITTKNDLRPAGFRQLRPPAAAVAAVAAAAPAGGNGELVGLLRELLSSRLAALDPQAQFENTLKLAKQIQPAAAAPAAAPAAVLDPLTQRILDAALKRLEGPAPAAAVDPLEHYRKMGDVMESLGWARPGGNAGGGWSVEGIINGAAQLLSAFVQFKALQAGMGAAAPAMPASFLAPPMPAAPAAMPAGGAMPPAGAGVSSPAGFPGGVNGMDFSKIGLMIQVGTGAIESIERGESGRAFAERICQNAALADIYDDLWSKGKAAILEQVKMVGTMRPELAAKIQAAGGRIDTWLDDFLSFGVAEGEGDTQVLLDGQGDVPPEAGNG